MFPVQLHYDFLWNFLKSFNDISLGKRKHRLTYVVYSDYGTCRFITVSSMLLDLELVLRFVLVSYVIEKHKHVRYSMNMYSAGMSPPDKMIRYIKSENPLIERASNEEIMSSYNDVTILSKILRQIH